MRFDELDRFKNQYPQLAPYISAVESYLDSMLRLGQPREIVPSLMAERLSIDEPLAISVLSLFDEAHVIEPRYQVRCLESDYVLGEYKSQREIPARIYCPVHETEHDKNGYYVELVFVPTPNARERTVA